VKIEFIPKNTTLHRSDIIIIIIIIICGILLLRYGTALLSIIAEYHRWISKNKSTRMLQRMKMKNDDVTGSGDD